MAESFLAEAGIPQECLTVAPDSFAADFSALSTELRIDSKIDFDVSIQENVQLLKLVGEASSTLHIQTAVLS